MLNLRHPISTLAFNPQSELLTFASKYDKAAPVANKAVLPANKAVLPTNKAALLTNKALLTKKANPAVLAKLALPANQVK